MKRVRIKIEHENGSASFYARECNRIANELADRKARRELKKAQKRERLRLDRDRIEATTAADSYVTRLMNEARFAQRVTKTAKEFEQETWAKLSRYLIDGIRDDGKRPRIRIVDHNDIPAERQQRAR
jgi:hypothetical protein